MAAGGLARIELAGGATQAALVLPRPTGTIALRVTGTVSDLRIQASNGRPVRLRLGEGADTATVDGTAPTTSGPASRSPPRAGDRRRTATTSQPPRGWARSSSTTRHEADGRTSSSSANTTSRRLRIVGRTATTSAATARARSAAEIGRVRNTDGSPREMMSARRRFSSSSGPRTKPSSSGAGSQPHLIRT